MKVVVGDAETDLEMHDAASQQRARDAKIRRAAQDGGAQRRLPIWLRCDADPDIALYGFAVIQNRVFHYVVMAMSSDGNHFDPARLPNLIL